MKPSLQSIKEDRPLTEQEETLVRWLLEHGKIGAGAFVPQLRDARVVAGCGCGCASIEFAAGGHHIPLSGSMAILSDYAWRDASGNLFGAFIFARDGVLAGLDLWSLDGEATATHLPEPGELMPIEELGNA